MQKSIFVFCFVLFFLSCGEQKNEIKIPANVLDKEKFSQLICDFTMAEAATSVNVKNVFGNKSDSAYAFNPLYDNDITKKTFDTTVYFYSHHPALYKEVYELTLEKLSRLQSSRK